jgi:hypothetical protein
MKDFVSCRATSVVAGIASMSIVCSFGPYGLPWPVTIWASLALAAGSLLALRSDSSLRPATQGGSLPPRETRTR